MKSLPNGSLHVRFRLLILFGIFLTADLTSLQEIHKNGGEILLVKITSIDLYAGLGYGTDFGGDFRSDYAIAIPDYSNDLSIAFTAGMKIRVLLPNKN